MAVGTLDHPERVTPTDHIWIESKRRWLALADGMPQFSQGPPAT